MADVRAVERGDDSPQERLRQTFINNRRFPHRSSAKEGLSDALSAVTPTQLGALVLRTVYRADDYDAAEIAGISPERFAARIALVARYGSFVNLLAIDARRGVESQFEKRLGFPKDTDPRTMIEWFSRLIELPCASELFRSLTLKQKASILTAASGVSADTILAPEFCFQGDQRQFVLYVYGAIDDLRKRVVKPLDPYYGTDVFVGSTGGFKARKSVLSKLMAEEDFAFWAHKINPQNIEIATELARGVKGQELADVHGITRQGVASRFRSTIDVLDSQRRGKLLSQQSEQDLDSSLVTMFFSAEGQDNFWRLPPHNRFILLARITGMSVRDTAYCTQYNYDQVDARVRSSIGYIKRHLSDCDRAPDFAYTSISAVTRLKARLEEISHEEIRVVLPSVGDRHRSIIAQIIFAPSDSDYDDIPVLAGLTRAEANRVVRAARKEFFVILKIVRQKKNIS